MKKYIELTDDQIEKLTPLFNQVDRHSNGKPVMLLAQILMVNGSAVAVCGIISHAKSLKIQEAMSTKSVGKVIDYKQAITRLQKARTS